MQTNIHQILKQYWGYSQFRPLQEDIIQSVLEGKDTLALMPTGGGKSLCFQVPALAMEGICIVVSPLIALMQDQVEQLQKRGIDAKAIFSGMRYREIDYTLDNCVYGKVKFLYVSPERLQTDIFKERLKKMKVCLLAIDEAHCISQWGYDFRPYYLKIGEIRTLIPHVPCIALTATATPQVQKDIQEKLLFGKNRAVFQKSFARPNLSYSVFEEQDKTQRILKILQNVKGTSIVYARSRKKTEQIANFLCKNGVSAEAYHAGLSSKERSQKQENWIQNKTRVIVATNAFGMGIDKPDVRTVIHIDMPDTPEAYYQEAGRAGRDEQKAYSILLYSPQDLKDLQRKVEEAHPSPEEIRRIYQMLANYFKVAEHSEPIEPILTFPFDVEHFCKTYKLVPYTTYCGLKILEKQGFILMNEGFYTPSKVRLLVDRHKLYEFQVANAKFDDFIKLLMRYGGGELFTSYITISEEKMSRIFNLPIEVIYGYLRNLHQQNIIDYVQQTDKPQLSFTTIRYKAENLPLDIEKIDFFKKRAEERMKAMQNYATTTMRCRTDSLLDYFGENYNQRCGVCDNCLKMKKNEGSFAEEALIKQEILNILSEKKSILLTTLVSFFPEKRKNRVIQVIKEKLALGELIQTSTGEVTLK